jgi:hypothetical protein
VEFFFLLRNTFSGEKKPVSACTKKQRARWPVEAVAYRASKSFKEI